MAGRVAVVDDRNRFLRWTTREEVHGDRLPHRSVHVLVFDSAGRLVLQQRHPDKLTWPSHWDISVAGHVEEEDYPAGPDDDLDAVYAAVAARELAEELGLSTPLRRLGRFGPEPGVHYEHLQLFETTSDGPYALQAEEVARIHAVSAAAFDRLDAPTTHTLHYWVRWLRTQGRFTTTPEESP